MIFPNPAKDDLFDRDTIVEDAQTDHASAEVNWHTIAKARFERESNLETCIGLLALIENGIYVRSLGLTFVA